MHRPTPPIPASTVCSRRRRSTRCRSIWPARGGSTSGQLAARNRNTRLVVDHLGLAQPHEPPVPAEPWAELPKVLALPAHENVAVKISGACTLSHEPYPYNDIWDPLCRVFDAFGIDRCMWGTDWTRAVGMLTYKQGVDAFLVTDRLSQTERAALMGQNSSRYITGTGRHHNRCCCRSDDTETAGVRRRPLGCLFNPPRT